MAREGRGVADNLCKAFRVGRCGGDACPQGKRHIACKPASCRGKHCAYGHPRDPDVSS
jgi:hypothetical protein